MSRALLILCSRRLVELLRKSDHPAADRYLVETKLRENGLWFFGVSTMIPENNPDGFAAGAFEENPLMIELMTDIVCGFEPEDCDTVEELIRSIFELTGHFYN